MHTDASSSLLTQASRRSRAFSGPSATSSRPVFTDGVLELRESKSQSTDRVGDGEQSQESVNGRKRRRLLATICKWLGGRDSTIILCRCLRPFADFGELLRIAAVNATSSLRLFAGACDCLRLSATRCHSKCHSR
jgi:hypothetical protein